MVLHSDKPVYIGFKLLPDRCRVPEMHVARRTLVLAVYWRFL